MRERKMAFPPTRRVRMGVGDQLLLYTTRGVFNNPTRDRGRVVGYSSSGIPHRAAGTGASYRWTHVYEWM
jgi:hypothetical protein